MIFSTFALMAALAPSAIFAAPTPTIPSISHAWARTLSSQEIKAIENGSCDLANVKMPNTASTPLPAPAAGLTLAHVAIGRGVQNYTCDPANPSSTPTSIGAIATLFNATCTAARAPAVLSNMTSLALKYAIPTSEFADRMQSGHHEFNTLGQPFFSLDTTNANYGSVTSKKNATSAAPAGSPAGDNGYGSVAWLKLVGLTGDYKEVYRMNTAGGNPPATCEGLSGTFSVEYAAEYYFWK